MVVSKKSLANLRPSKPWMTNNPNWQPRKWISLVNKELRDKWFKPATKNDIIENYMSLLNLEQEVLTEFAKDKKKPMMIRIIAKAMLSWKWFDIIERMLDRWIWKAMQSSDVKVTWVIWIKQILEEIDEDNDLTNPKWLNKQNKKN